MRCMFNILVLAWRTSWSIQTAAFRQQNKNKTCSCVLHPSVTFLWSLLWFYWCLSKESLATVSFLPIKSASCCCACTCTRMVNSSSTAGSSIRDPSSFPNTGGLHLCETLTQPVIVATGQQRHYRLTNCQTATALRMLGSACWPRPLRKALRKLLLAHGALYPRWTRGCMGSDDMLVRSGMGLGPVAGEAGAVVQWRWAQLWLSDRLPTAAAAQDTAAGCGPRSAWGGGGWLENVHTLLTHQLKQAEEEFPPTSEIWTQHSSRDIILMSYLPSIIRERTRNHGNCSFVYPQTKDQSLRKPAIKGSTNLSLICFCETFLGKICRQIEIWFAHQSALRVGDLCDPMPNNGFEENDQTLTGRFRAEKLDWAQGYCS